MRNIAALVVPAFLLLPACSESYGGTAIHVHTHQALPAHGTHSIRVENTSGQISVSPANGNAITVDATENADDTDAIHRTHINIAHDLDQVTVHTTYDGEGLFSHTKGASVDYTIHVPAALDVTVENVSGPIIVQGLSGNLRANDVSGAVRASLGRVSGSRFVEVNQVSGPIDVALTKNSDVRVEGRTVSGAVHAFFPANIQKGFVGQSLDGRVGSGSASLRLSAVSGSIDITRQ